MFAQSRLNLSAKTRMHRSKRDIFSASLLKCKIWQTYRVRAACCPQYDSKKAYRASPSEALACRQSKEGSEHCEIMTLHLVCALKIMIPNRFVPSKTIWVGSASQGRLNSVRKVRIRCPTRTPDHKPGVWGTTRAEKYSQIASMPGIPVSGHHMIRQSISLMVWNTLGAFSCTCCPSLWCPLSCFTSGSLPLPPRFMIPGTSNYAETRGFEKYSGTTLLAYSLLRVFRPGKTSTVRRPVSP